MNRARILIYLTVVVFLVLLIRIYNLTVKSNTYYDELANNNIIRNEPIIPIRGQILDRNALPLAVNELGFSISITPHLSAKSGQKKLDTLLATLHHYFPDINVTELKKDYVKNDSPYNHEFINMIDFIPHQDMQHIYPLLIQNNDIKIAPSTTRFYPNKTMASHLIGYIGKANKKEADSSKIAKLSTRIGKSGIEKEYNDFLAGELGYEKIKITAFNEELGLVDKKEPVQNNDLFLTIDARLQKTLDASFKDRNESGAAIVMDVRNGEILAAGSYPNYDINLFVNGISSKDWNSLIKNPNNPFTNKLISGLYPPGSVIKMGVGLSFLKNGIDPNEKVLCTGELTFGGRDFRCWNSGGHGNLNLSDAIKNSCDVYFYKQSLSTGIDKIADTLTMYGLGQKTGIDLPNEFYGVIPSREWKKKKYNKSWYIGETLISAIGQGYNLVTPIQIAKYTTAIATGDLVTPKLNLLKETISTPIPKDYQKNIDIIRKAMKRVCNEPGGTAYYRMHDTPVTVACKTGTAQVIGIPQEVKKRKNEKELEYYHRSHAWLTTYLPYDDPKYVITVMVEHGGHGGSACSPIAREMIDKMIELGYLTKEEQR